MLGRRRIIGVLAACIIISLAVLTGCAGMRADSGSAPQRVVLKLGTETAGESPETRGSQRLADLVRQKSDGTLVIDVYENAKLGTMKERDEGMRMGTIDMGTSSVGFLAAYAPILGIFDLPYIYKDKAHELRVFDSEIGKNVDTKLQAEGLRVICYFDAGARQITNNRRPIETPADLKGLRIRVPQTDASMEGFRALGAIPTALSFGEVYSALKQNVVEGQENPVSLVLYNRFHEVQRYLSITNHQHFIQVLTISEKTWRRLAPRHQEILLECAKEAQAYQREIVASEEQALIKVLQDKGMKINAVKNTAEFAELAKPLRSLYIRKLGKPAADLFERIDSLRN